MKQLITEIFDYLEIDRGIFLAGLIGAAISMTNKQKTPFWKAIILIIIGAFVAGYVTPLLSELIDNEKLLNSMAFLIGLTSMRIIEGILKFADNFKQNPVEFFKNFIKK